MSYKSKLKHYSKAGLKARGWTDTAITRFLGEPDKLAPNPHHRSGPKMRLYLRERVHQTEELPEVKERLRKTIEGKEKRRVVAEKAVKTKRKRLLEEVRSWKITVPKLSRGELREAVGYNTDVDEATLKRWMLNFLRHEMTSYHQKLRAIEGKVGNEEAYELLKDRINRAILEAYPFLEEDEEAESSG